MAASLMETYAPLPVAFKRGKGVYLYDENDRAYLDALSGLAVCGLGHAHPAVQAALNEQAGNLLHTSNLYHIPVQEALAAELCAISGMEKVFFGNSGAEANEAAIKIARKHGRNQGVQVPTIVVMEGAFHGRTIATLTASGSRKVQAGFEPLVEGFCRAPYNNMEALEHIAVNCPEVVAVMLEPILGESGVIVPDADYLTRIRALCDAQGWLMMLDEVQTGNGRTGNFFAYQASDILPDVVTTAKGLANGVPIGACLATAEAAEALQIGNHGSTFGGNPLASAAALAVLKTLQSERLIERAGQLGELMQKRLHERLRGNNRVRDIRGQGLMIGIELTPPIASDFAEQALQQGLLLNVTQGNVVRLLPPLILTDAEAEKIVDMVSGLITNHA